ncbi:hypothetical protein ALC56_08072, partial [Trachymyrmex septentrionalis]
SLQQERQQLQLLELLQQRQQQQTCLDPINNSIILKYFSVMPIARKVSTLCLIQTALSCDISTTILTCQWVQLFLAMTREPRSLDANHTLTYSLIVVASANSTSVTAATASKFLKPFTILCGALATVG